MATITLTLNIPEAFAQALAAKHPAGLEAAAAVALKAYVKGGRPVINTDRDAEIARLILDGVRRADIASAHKLSLVRINQIAAERGINMSATKTAINADRDAAIVTMLKAGKRHTDIAKEFGLSITRVSQLAALNDISIKRLTAQEKELKRKLEAEAKVRTKQMLAEWAEE